MRPDNCKTMKKILLLQITVLFCPLGIFPSIAHASPRNLVSSISTVTDQKVQQSTNPAKKLGDPILDGHYFYMKKNPYLAGYFAYEKANQKYQLLLAKYEYKVAHLQKRNDQRNRKREEKLFNKLALAKMKQAASARHSGGGLLRSSTPLKSETPMAAKPAEPAEKPASLLTKGDDVEKDGIFVLRRKADQPVDSTEPETTEPDQEAKPSLWVHFKRALVGR